jgi:hypothetical protein
MNRPAAAYLQGGSMDIAIRAAHEQIASERILAASAILADRFALPELGAALAAAGHRDPSIDALFKAEATADLLDALVDATAPQTDIPNASDRLGALTVTEAEALIADVQTVDELDALEAAEVAGKQRKGIYVALQARRDELDAQTQDAPDDETEPAEAA